MSIRSSIISRRSLLAAPALLLPSAAFADGINNAGKIGGGATGGTGGGIAGAAGSGGSAFPGQSGNPVGYAATPATAPAAFTAANGGTWPGAFSSLTAFPGAGSSITISSGTNATSGAGTLGNPYVFAFRDFDVGSGVTQINLANCIFVGCRFQSNNSPGANTQTGSANVNFIYCSFVPRAALYTAPPGLIWPSAGALANTTTQTTNVNCIDGNSGFQVGLSVSIGGSIVADHCDCWGLGNSFSQFTTTTTALTYTDCWVHDAANASPQGYHIDGIGYVNGAAAPSNVTIKHCTIASIGNTNAIAFQTASSAYSNISITQCYLTGFGYNTDMCHNIAGSTNLTFTDNTFATDLQWVFGPVFAGSTLFNSVPTNTWRRNKFLYVSGTTPASGSLAWTPADSGKFVYPDGSLNVTDWPN